MGVRKQRIVGKTGQVHVSETFQNIYHINKIISYTYFSWILAAFYHMDSITKYKNRQEKREGDRDREREIWVGGGN